jgi:hypothetical protein
MVIILAALSSKSDVDNRYKNLAAINTEHKPNKLIVKAEFPSSDVAEAVMIPINGGASKYTQRK